MAQRDRLELAVLLKKVESHRQRITELQKSLALLMQKIARVGSRTRAADDERKGPAQHYK